MADRYTLYGGVGSPYSCKVRSYLRYKRIPFNWTPPTFAGAMNKWPNKFKHIRPKVIPVLEFPDGFTMNESTKIFEKIEEIHPNRPIFMKDNKCHQFIADLLEDFADEWCTKLMYAMRWNRPIDQDFGSTFIVYKAPFSMRQFVKENMTKRQIQRTKLVGCDNDQEIHASFHEICGIWETFLKNNYFLFGMPTNADFGFYGQMRQFAVDVTSNALLRERYPLLFCWLYKMDDLSGIQVENGGNGFKISEAVMKLLNVCGNVYLPFLKANSEALKNGNEMFSVDLLIDGKVFKHRQKPFKWQGRCLKRLHNKFNALRYENGFGELKEILQRTNCWRVFNGDVQSKL